MSKSKSQIKLTQKEKKPSNNINVEMKIAESFTIPILPFIIIARNRIMDSSQKTPSSTINYSKVQPKTEDVPESKRIRPKTSFKSNQ